VDSNPHRNSCREIEAREPVDIVLLGEVGCSYLFEVVCVDWKVDTGRTRVGLG
jgi:hypothetical protein